MHVKVSTYWLKRIFGASIPSVGNYECIFARVLISFQVNTEGVHFKIFKSFANYKAWNTGYNHNMYATLE